MKLSRVKSPTNLGGKIVDFICSAPHEHRLLKALLGFPVGSAIGVVLYFTIVTDLQLPDLPRKILGLLIGSFLAFGFAAFVQVRCISLLAIPLFVSRNGRKYLSALSIVLILNGPVATIFKNFGEASRSLACSAELAANQTAVYAKLATGPIMQMLPTMDKDASTVEFDIKGMLHSFKAVVGEIENKYGLIDKIMTRVKEIDFGNVKKINIKDIKETFGVGSKEEEVEELTREEIVERNYFRKPDEEDEEREQEYREMALLKCMELHNEAYSRCKAIFVKYHKKCFDKLPWGFDYLLCWPLKTMKLCNLLKMLTKQLINCDLVPPIPKKFGRLYVDLKYGVEKLPGLFEVNLQYSLDGLNEIYHKQIKEPLKNARDDLYERYKEVGFKVDMKGVKDLATDLQLTFDYIKTLLLGIFALVRRLVDFIFFYIIFLGIKYHNHYANNLDYDNVYITNYFKRIDERRYKRGKRILLPLKKVEAKVYQEPLRLGMTSPEIVSCLITVVTFIVKVSIYALVFQFDLLLYKVMVAVRDNAHIEYSVDGIHEIKFIVRGKGMLADLFRKIFRAFSAREEVDYDANTLQCLPHPFQTEVSAFYNVLTLNIIAMCVVFLEIYFERAMHAICGFFYRRVRCVSEDLLFHFTLIQRAKERTLHIYNKLLLKRNSFLQRMRHKVKRKAIELQIEHEHNLVYTLVKNFPKLFGRLRFLQRRKCLICDDVDDGTTFVECPNVDCPFAYCAFCWRDVEAQCFACRPLEGWATDDASSDDQELAMAD